MNYTPAGATSVINSLVAFIVGCDPGEDQGVLQAGTPRRRPQPASVRSTMGPRQPEEAILAHRGSR